MGTTGEVWLSCPRPSPDADQRLVCFPYAGGGTSVFWPWAEVLGRRVEVWFAQLPGRERRFGEPARTDMAAVADPLAAAVEELGSPVTLFGHSMGGLIAFEVARRLGERVERLLVSASKAPRLPLGHAPHLGGDDELVDWITRLGGVPAGVEPDMLALLLPTLRADLTLVDGYLGAGSPSPVAVPVTAFAGTDDPLATVEQVSAWRDYTTAAFELVTRPGAHFYLNDDPSPILGAVSARAKEGAL